MSNKLQLQIPEPCHENWDKMNPVEKGRFCNSCQKAVVDFTGMSDAQLVAFFKKPITDSTCGRLQHDQLNRDLMIPRKRIPWLKYFFQIVIPAFLFSSRAKAQGEIVTVKDTIVQCESPKIEEQFRCLIEKKEKVDTSKVSGRVVDTDGRPIPYASVLIKGTNQGTLTNENGEFKLRGLPEWQKMNLAFSSVGFNDTEILILRSDLKKEYIVTLTMYNTGMVFVGLIAEKKKPPKSLIHRIFKDTTFKFFKVYPNPAAINSTVNIELKKADAGEYQIELIAAAGQTVYSGVPETLAKKETVSFKIPTIISGSYLVQLTNKKTSKKYVEKIIIQ